MFHNLNYRKVLSFPSSYYCKLYVFYFILAIPETTKSKDLSTNSNISTEAKDNCHATVGYNNGKNNEKQTKVLEAALKACRAISKDINEFRETCDKKFTKWETAVQQIQTAVTQALPVVSTCQDETIEGRHSLLITKNENRSIATDV